MQPYVNYEGKKICFNIPEAWHSITDKELPAAKVLSDPVKEIGRALDFPIGSPRIEELARPGMDVVLLFDDLQRHTPAHLAIPEIMDRLNIAQIPDKSIKGVCALGTHPSLTIDQMRLKIGEAAAYRLEGRLFCHDPHSEENIIIGRTKRGTIVELNPHVARADMAIGIGECMPHSIAGYSGGYKLLFPGVCSYRSVADHHFTWMRHPHSRVNIMEGNHFWEEIVDAGRLSRMVFKLDFVLNERGEVIRVFCGDPVEQQKEGARFVEDLYRIDLPKLADITITSAFPLEIGVQPTKALDMATFCTRKGGTIIWIAPQKESGPLMPLLDEISSRESAGEFHRRLIKADIPPNLREFGISFIMQVVFFKERAENYKVIHVTEGLSREQVEMMGYGYAAGIQEAVDLAARELPEADVAIFPSGGKIMPIVI